MFPLQLFFRRVLSGEMCAGWRAHGEKLFLGITRPPSDEKLGSAARQCGWAMPERFGTHSIRREAARAMLEAGGSFAQLLKAGRWHSSAFR